MRCRNISINPSVNLKALSGLEPAKRPYDYDDQSKSANAAACPQPCRCRLNTCFQTHFFPVRLAKHHALSSLLALYTAEGFCSGSHLKGTAPQQQLSSCSASMCLSNVALKLHRNILLRAHTAARLLSRFWNRLVDMPDDWLAKQAILANVALMASGTGHVRSACWAVQVESFLLFMQRVRCSGKSHFWMRVECG